MSDEVLTFSLGEHGETTVRGWSGLIKWLEQERANWEWLASGKPETDAHGFASNIQNQWTQIQSNIQSLHSQAQPLSSAPQYLQPISNGPLLVHDEPLGAMVLDIRASAGETAAAFAYAYLTSSVQLSSARNRQEFLGAILTVIPDLREPAEFSERLKRERSNYKEGLKSAIARLDAAAEERDTAFAATVNRGKAIAARMLRKRRDSWRLHQDAWQDSADEAVESIRTTERTYSEFMQLQAPVEYWKSKATTHGTKETKARRNVMWFFGVSALVLLAAFLLAGRFILNHPPTGTNPAPVALYVVVSSGLAVLVTIAFWIGRLLTKLYLSEHHLRNDAEERAVMTTTYLALTKEKGAEETDRQIVLNALFRTTSDGIVKDDGPSDLSFQAAISKVLARP